MGDPVIAIVGPTASGKSDLGLELARRFDGEIINADSMQLYSGMDIGTAKLSKIEQRGIPHHLLDIWDVTRTATVAEYQQLARHAIADIHARNRVPVLVGGSGLYVRAVLDDMHFPGTDDRIRARLENELGTLGAGALHSRLSALDPPAAQAILPSNGRRVVRALEVIELTGRPYTAHLPDYREIYECVHIALDMPLLDSRINDRVDCMWAKGLVDEVRDLENRGLRTGRTASRAVGYRQVLDFLSGFMSEEEAKDHTKQATRRLARVQRSWFRRDSRLSWLDSSSTHLADQASDLVNVRLRNGARP